MTEEYSTVVKFHKKESTKKCPMCDGYARYNVVGPGGSTTIDPCDHCNGTGQVPK
jgi:DnaJ-class molecular chaperone